MTWSLQLRNGDLSLGNASYGTVTGEDKLVQDLRTYILEQMGTDDMHPTFGSLLNGGRLEDGTVVPGSIGDINDSFTQLEVESEIRRIVIDFQGRQLRRAKDDRTVFGKTTLTRGEILLSVVDIDMQQTGDILNITIILQTAKGSTIELGLEV